MTTLPALRLLQLADSAFPVGGFAFSHGIEWLVDRGLIRGERDLDDVLRVYVAQGIAQQALPAALRAARAQSFASLRRTDAALDASFPVAGERESGRAMGERLLVTATESFGGSRASMLLAQIRDGVTPGQYAVAFGVVASEQGVEEPDMLAALGNAMALAVVQAAVRLTIVGQSVAARLVAGAAPDLDAAVRRVLKSRPHASFGAFAPGLDVAGMLHPTLGFRMFNT